VVHPVDRFPFLVLPLVIQLRRYVRVVCLGAGANALLTGALMAAQATPDFTTGRAAQSFTEPSPADTGGTVPTESLPPLVVPYERPANPWADRLGYEREHLVHEWTDHPVDLQPIYFPPAPPVLGAPVPAVGLFVDETVRGLAPYVAEPFYAPLSTRLVEGDLGRRVRARLETYQGHKAALLAELRAQLQALRLESVTVRRQKLAELAAIQEPELAALEETADELRREFFRTRFFGGGGDWNQFRAWRLDPADPLRNHPELRMRELRMLRAAIYYQEGLSAGQRRLLRELVIDQAADLRVPGAGFGPPKGDTARVIFFSPDVARVALPPEMPEELEALIIDYTARKNALKQELRDRLVRLDADRNATRRTRSLEDLAGEQTVRLADLEKLADRIREQLAPLVQAQIPVAPLTLPGALEGRVAAYLRDKSELQRVAQEQLAVALAAFDLEEKNSKAPSQPERRAAAVRATVDAFHTFHADTIAALNAEAEAIRGELVRHAATPSVAAAPPGAGASLGAGKSVDALLRDFADAFKRQQLAALYAEYHAALFEPGLSLAQRRLLFDGAVADLKLPGAIRDQQVSANEVLSRP
jgi:hypothetical protein